MDWNSTTMLEFEITTYCQAKCALCAKTNAKTLKKESWLRLQHLALDDYKNALDQIKLKKEIDFKSISTIELCGDYGDPAMHPQVEEFIDYAVENNYSVFLHTNGGIRGKDWYEKIAKKYKNDDVVVIFGIDGLDAETNSKYRSGVNFDSAWENMMTYAKNTKYRTAWHFIIFDFNYDQLETAYLIAKAHNIHFKPYVNKRLSNFYDRIIKDSTLKMQLEERCNQIGFESYVARTKDSNQ